MAAGKTGRAPAKAGGRVKARETVRWIDPEETRLETELAALAEELASVEAELAVTGARLEVFTRQHDRMLAPLYAELDEVDAQIVEFAARVGGRPEDLRDAEAARKRARESADAARATAGEDGGYDGSDAGNTSPPVPSAEARRAYRDLAKRCHPDLGTDDADRARRAEFMARVNEAYAQGDLTLLKRLADEWTGEAPAPAGDGDRLAWLRDTVGSVRHRLADVRDELGRLTGTGLGPLLFAERDPDGALRRLAERVRTKIEQRRAELAALRGSQA
jgi:hypothetical protein